MKIYAVRDENEKNTKKDLAYLIYYDKAKCFYIELPEDADAWETPLLLSSFAKKGIKTVGAYFSMLWVRQRIVPEDRQNLGQILKENGLEEYDEYALLMLGQGRCAQDSYYLSEITRQELPKSFASRYRKRIADAIPETDGHLLVFFQDRSVKKCHIPALTHDNPRFLPILKRRELFEKVHVSVGGYEISWGENLTIPDYVLYDNGDATSLESEDFALFAAHGLVGTSGAAEILGCSRQYVDELARSGQLRTVKVDTRNKLFLKSEVLERTWK